MNNHKGKWACFLFLVLLLGLFGHARPAAAEEAITITDVESPSSPEDLAQASGTIVYNGVLPSLTLQFIADTGQVIDVTNRSVIEIQVIDGNTATWSAAIDMDGLYRRPYYFVQVKANFNGHIITANSIDLNESGIPLCNANTVCPPG